MKHVESPLLRRIYEQARRDGYSPAEARAVQVLCSQPGRKMEERARAVLRAHNV